jgi:hypothetical protein
VQPLGASMRWSRSQEACINCGTTRRPHHSRGYCKPCSTIMRRVRQAEKWDRTDPKSLKGLPRIPWWTREAILAGLDRRDWSDEEFERYRAEALRQLQEVLTQLRSEEESRQRVPNGWMVESRLRFVLRNMRLATDQCPPGWSGRSIEDRFNDEQRSIIYGLLTDLTDHIPRWRGFNYEELLRRAATAPDEVGPS